VMLSVLISMNMFRHLCALGTGTYHLKGVSYDPSANVHKPWRVKKDGKTLDRFVTKRQAADFYRDMTEAVGLAYSDFRQEYLTQ
jgi:hypothetical protein